MLDSCPKYWTLVVGWIFLSQVACSSSSGSSGGESATSSSSSRSRHSGWSSASSGSSSTLQPATGSAFLGKYTNLQYPEAPFGYNRTDPGFDAAQGSSTEGAGGMDFVGFGSTFSAAGAETLEKYPFQREEGIRIDGPTPTAALPRQQTFRFPWTYRWNWTAGEVLFANEGYLVMADDGVDLLRTEPDAKGMPAIQIRSAAQVTPFTTFPADVERPVLHDTAVTLNYEASEVVSINQTTPPPPFPPPAESKVRYYIHSLRTVSGNEAEMKVSYFRKAEFEGMGPPPAHAPTQKGVVPDPAAAYPPNLFLSLVFGPPCYNQSNQVRFMFGEALGEPTGPFELVIPAQWYGPRPEVYPSRYVLEDKARAGDIPFPPEVIDIALTASTIVSALSAILLLPPPTMMIAARSQILLELEKCPTGYNELGEFTSFSWGPLHASRNPLGLVVGDEITEQYAGGLVFYLGLVVAAGFLQFSVVSLVSSLKESDFLVWAAKGRFPGWIFSLLCFCMVDGVTSSVLLGVKGTKLHTIFLGYSTLVLLWLASLIVVLCLTTLFPQKFGASWVQVNTRRGAAKDAASGGQGFVMALLGRVLWVDRPQLEGDTTTMSALKKKWIDEAKRKQDEAERGSDDDFLASGKEDPLLAVGAPPSIRGSDLSKKAKKKDPLRPEDNPYLGFLGRWGALFVHYEYKAKAFLTVELFINLILGTGSALRAFGSEFCVSAIGLILGAFTVYFFAVSLCRPFVSSIDCVFFSLIALCQLAAAVIVFVAHPDMGFNISSASSLQGVPSFLALATLVLTALRFIFIDLIPILIVHTWCPLKRTGGWGMPVVGPFALPAVEAVVPGDKAVILQYDSRVEDPMVLLRAQHLRRHALLPDKDNHEMNGIGADYEDQPKEAMKQSKRDTRARRDWDCQSDRDRQNDRDRKSDRDRRPQRYFDDRDGRSRRDYDQGPKRNQRNRKSYDESRPPHDYRASSHQQPRAGGWRGTQSGQRQSGGYHPFYSSPPPPQQARNTIRRHNRRRSLTPSSRSESSYSYDSYDSRSHSDSSFEPPRRFERSERRQQPLSSQRGRENQNRSGGQPFALPVSSGATDIAIERRTREWADQHARRNASKDRGRGRHSDDPYSPNRIRSRGPRTDEQPSYKSPLEPLRAQHSRVPVGPTNSLPEGVDRAEYDAL